MPTTTVPPVGANPDLDQLLSDIFVTAIESGADGIGYWADVHDYQWSVDRRGSAPDLAGFYAVITDNEDADGTEASIDREVIHRGLYLVAGGEIVPNRPTLTGMARLALVDPDNPRIDFDADAADIIVQAGLFGEVVYG